MNILSAAWGGNNSSTTEEKNVSVPVEGELVELETSTDYRALALDLAVTLACGAENGPPDTVAVTQMADVLLAWLENESLSG